MLIFRTVLFMISFQLANCFILDIVKYLYNEFIQCEGTHHKSDVGALNSDLQSFLFGQPLVASVVTNSIKSHSHSTPSKPLALSFHGSTGSGKTYVSKFIVDRMFSGGFNNPNVYRFNAKMDFPYENRVSEYQEKLKNKIMNAVRRCKYAIFVFEEVDKFPPYVMDIVKPFLDYRTMINGVDFRHTIFIFTSNIGSDGIVKKTLELWKNGVDRKDFKFRDFEKFLTLASFNEKGGFLKSDLIDSHLIDFFVPFLPLEEKHVRQCIEFELGQMVNKPRVPKKYYDSITEEIIKDLNFGPEPERLFAVAGCKRVEKLVRTYKEEVLWKYADEL